MTPAQLGQDTVIAILVIVGLWLYLKAASQLGQYLHNLDTRRQFQAHLETEARRVRLEKLVVLADEYEAAQTDKERAKLYRKATDLGFTEPYLTDYAQAVTSWQDDVEVTDCKPWLCDDNEQPHLPKAS